MSKKSNYIGETNKTKPEFDTDSKKKRIRLAAQRIYKMFGGDENIMNNNLNPDEYGDYISKFSLQDIETAYYVSSDSYKEGNYYAIMSYYMRRNFRGTRTLTLRDDPMTKLFSDLANKYTKKIFDTSSKNILTGNEIENYKTYPEIVELRDKYNPKTDYDYMSLFIIQLCTMQAPLRNDFFSSVNFTIDLDYYN